MTAALTALLDDLLLRTPSFSPEEQEAGVAIYQLLSRGSPVTDEAVAARLGWTAGRATAVLRRANLRSLTYRDPEGRIVGFAGLAIPPMSHRITIEGRTMHAWCAWDTLFLPVVLGREARIESDVPGGGVVRVTAGPDGVKAVEPSEAVMSFLLPTADAFDEDALKAMASFCHFIFFFPHREAAEAWSVEHPGTMLLSLDDAFELGRVVMHERWGTALGGDR